MLEQKRSMLIRCAHISTLTFKAEEKGTTFQLSGKLLCFLFFQRQNLVCYLRNPHYGSLIYADGHGEVWTDWNNMSKFSQYGWRCTTNENSYSNRTLIGNWNQERYDIKNVVQPKPLPSQVI